MAYVLKKVGKSANIPFRTFECDNISDMNKIPTAGLLMGSRCYVINEGKEYALNSQGEWRLVPFSSNGGGSTPDTPDTDDNIIYDGGDEDEV